MFTLMSAGCVEDVLVRRQRLGTVLHRTLAFSGEKRAGLGDRFLVSPSVSAVRILPEPVCVAIQCCRGRGCSAPGLQQNPFPLQRATARGDGCLASPEPVVAGLLTAAPAL